MDYFSKKKTLFWIIIILLCVNVMSLGALWFITLHNSDERFSRDMRRHSFKRFHLEDRLGLNNEQRKKFREFRAQHREKTIPIHYKIETLKKQLIIGLMDGKPPKEEERLIAEIGQQFSQFEKMTYTHFGNLKSICNHAQQKQLKRELIRFIEHKTPFKGRKWRGHRHGVHHGNGGPPHFSDQMEKGRFDSE